MYFSRINKNVMPDFEMVERIIKELNEKFDPCGMYYMNNIESKIFEFQYKTDDRRREAWQIVFMGIHTVVSGAFLGLDYADCQDEEYLTLETKNEKKILMLAVNETINIIDKFMSCIACSCTSEANKQKWIEVLKKGLREERL